MGNCLAVKGGGSSVSDIKSTVDGEFVESPILALCEKKISYVRKNLNLYASQEQKSKLGTIQKITDQLKESCRNLGVPDNMQTVLFHSILQETRRIRKTVENRWKLGLSDYDALLLKMERQKTPKLDIFQIIRLPKPSDVAPTMEDLGDINFPVLSYSNNNLMSFAGLVMKNTPYVVEQSIKSSKIDSFIQVICLNYNVTGYHNFSHAVSVFLMSHQTYHLSEEVRDYISPFELFCVLIAGISHDLNHRGRNNAYQVKKKSGLALLYSDQSVLQNMHISTLFRLMLENPDADILSGLKDPSMRARAKKIIVKCILATDMTTHFSSLKELKEKCHTEGEGEALSNPGDRTRNSAFQKDNDADRDFVMEMVIHACDIGNPCLESQNYMNWAALLTHQFDRQNKKEVLRGYQVTPMLAYTSKNNFYKGQIGFSRHFVLPLWKQISVFSPVLKLFPDQIENNISALQKMC